MKTFRLHGMAIGRAVKTLADGSHVHLEHGCAWRPVGPAVFDATDKYEAFVLFEEHFGTGSVCTECEEV